ncbi:MAG: ChpI protein [Spirochaetia bacterium]|jgi:metal-responsive CopG/Arc/MetJ family transcriptional regulator|nr:ChpI protein [Spirochaetia bacterium]
MKTAISLPDRLYKAAEKTAKSLGLPRSQLFAKALQEFIDKHAAEDITATLNRVYSDESSIQEASLKETDHPQVEALRELTKNDAW